MKAGARGQSTQKAYVVIYTCMATRAIFADIVLSQSTEAFLMSFKRLIATEGRPKHVYSDSAPYYLRANAELKECMDTLDATLEHASLEYEFEWHHNVPLGAHEGGVWERMIKTLKQALLKSCRHALLSYEEFITILKECTALLNDRPLINKTTDAIDVITPSLLTRGRLLRNVPDTFGDSLIPGKEEAKGRWRHRAQVMNHFFDLWKRNYVLGLQERSKWFTTKPNIRVGDVVVLHKEMTKRGFWPLARVVEIVKGRNDAIRHIKIAVPHIEGGADVHRPPQILERSVRFVCPLELADSRQISREHSDPPEDIGENHE